MSTIMPSGKNLQPQMNFLKPDYKAGSEERKRSASVTRLMFLGVALIVWAMVGLKVWDISLVVAERRPDEMEKARLSQEIADLQAVLSKVPSDVLNAREDLYTQVRWSERLATVKGLASTGVAFGDYRVQKDGTVRVNGLVSSPSIYANILDDISDIDFVTQIESSSLNYGERAGSIYEFHITFSTVPQEEK